MGKVWERPGRGHGSELFVFLVFPWFFAVWPKTSRTQKKSSDPWARSGLSTHKPKKQKNKKTRNQKNKKTKKQKKQKKQDCTPQGEGVRCRVLGLVFFFFVFLGFLFFCFFVFFVFWVFWFFGFLVCVWIAIADVPSRDCQALSVVALEVGQAKTKKTKKQKTKKPKNQKKKKTRLHTPRGGGQMQSVGSCLFVFFVFFWFFGFLFFWFVCG